MSELTLAQPKFPSIPSHACVHFVYGSPSPPYLGMVARAVVDEEELAVGAAPAAPGGRDFGYKACDCAPRGRRGVRACSRDKRGQLARLRVSRIKMDFEVSRPKGVQFSWPCLERDGRATYLLRPKYVDEVVPHLRISIGRQDFLPRTLVILHTIIIVFSKDM
jgi:hypothetical protein